MKVLPQVAEMGMQAIALPNEVSKGRRLHPVFPKDDNREQVHINRKPSVDTLRQVSQPDDDRPEHPDDTMP